MKETACCSQQNTSNSQRSAASFILQSPASLPSSAGSPLFHSVSIAWSREVSSCPIGVSLRAPVLLVPGVRGRPAPRTVRKSVNDSMFRTSVPLQCGPGFKARLQDLWVTEATRGPESRKPAGNSRDCKALRIWSRFPEQRNSKKSAFRLLSQSGLCTFRPTNSADEPISGNSLVMAIRFGTSMSSF
jgi:hypothetical protein